MTDAPSSAAGEWRRGWPLVAASVMGVALNAATLYSIGLFVMPLDAEFGWTRAQALSGLSFSAFVIFLLVGPLGAAIDRFNARAIALPGVVLCALGIAGFSFATPDVRVWMALWGFFAIGDAMVAPTVWLAAVSGGFTAHRSLAISIVLCGAGLASVVAPIASRWLIDAYGWRMAFRLLALFWGGACLFLSLPFFVDRRRPREPRADAPAAEPLAARLRKLVGSPAFLKIAVAVFCVVTVTGGLLVNLAPLLIDGGVPRARAAGVVGLAGFGVLAGKLSVGWLFERVPSAAVTTGAMLIWAAACVSFHFVGLGIGFALVGSVALGVCLGGMLAITACLTARLFDPAAFGSVFGALLSVMSLAGIVGPVAAGAAYDALHSYEALLGAGLASAIIAALLLRSLEPPARAAVAEDAR
jgi:predicted MFS family arabinose efflux permease